MLQMPLVGPIAKRFVFGQATSAQTERRSAAKAISVALGVHNFKIALYFQGAVGIYRYFGAGHFYW